MIALFHFGIVLIVLGGITNYIVGNIVPNTGIGSIKNILRLDQHNYVYPAEGDIDWSTVPRGEVRWFRCEQYNNTEFECGRLIAPLDYTNTDDPRNAHIALIRARATSNEPKLGTILTNPGGPGGSGLRFLTAVKPNQTLSTGQGISAIFGGQFDIVSFDPRGVGETVPKAWCFPDDSTSFLHDILAQRGGIVRAHTANALGSEIGELLGQGEVISDLCQNANGAANGTFHFMSTAFVARDMQLLHRALGDSQINYWGFSYGTLLGSVYADMFPEDVGRLVLDGVVDPNNYMSGLWNNHFINIEEEYAGFFAECVKAGPDLCKLATLAPSGEELQNRLSNWIERLKIQPVPAPYASPPQVLTYSLVLAHVFDIMYQPARWPQLAEELYEAVGLKNTSKLVDAAGIKFNASQKADAQAFWAIACGDVHTEAEGHQWDIDEYRDHLAVLEADSPTFAHFFARFAPVCQGPWTIRGAERHYGNFTSETAFPILTLGNDFDPVTPGEYADLVASFFPGAVSVHREGYGHCSTSQSSKCIQEILRNYFINGKLPEKGTRCAVDYPVFGAAGISEAEPDLSAIIAEGLQRA